jgi:anti-repressor protein
MNQLIKITENNGNKAVSARELHQFLESRERFSKWAKRMFEYGFEKDIDYTPYQNVQVQLEGEREVNRTINDYALTLDTAKEISMLQRTDKGKQARRYFIEIEKKATAPQPAMLDKNVQHHTLLAALKQNLKRGDMKDIARESGFTYDAVRNIFYASSRRPDVIQAIFERALANKKAMRMDTQNMLNQLNQ